ncbi:spore protease YyaC [Clostridium oryzae]|uniref:Spore protease YyaC n=1 Tax=Clostridium oryzae TaxID=1450648 RepID=A0A1V4IVJ9_9CLOT|nr:spore protease YyaC [Clostridium oryzae]OPJ63437.1 hypothetical protein CLORY_12190 [Clostridium oryzae]
MNKVKVHYKDSLAYYELAFFLKQHLDKDSVIVCIGTDRCIGDCLGPMVGTLLQEKHFPLPVYGTISKPIHALNLKKELSQINHMHPKANLIGIDACLGDTDSIGEIQIRNYPIHPGKGVGKSLPLVGEISIIGIVDTIENNELFSNRSIRLDLIINISKVIVDALFYAVNMSSN